MKPLLRRHDHPGLAKKALVAGPRVMVPEGYHEIAKSLRAACTRGQGMSQMEVARLVGLLHQQPVMRS